LSSKTDLALVIYVSIINACAVLGERFPTPPWNFKYQCVWYDYPLLLRSI